MIAMQSRAVAFGVIAALTTSLAAHAYADAVPSWCDASFNGGQTDVDGARLLDARAKFAKCADPACGKHLPGDCKDALDSVNKRIPSVTTLAVEGTTPLTGFTVTVDGRPMPTDGSSVEIDPGKHVFVFTTTDQRTKQIDAEVVESKRDQPVKAAFEAPAAPIATTATTTSPPPPPPPPPPGETVGSTRGSQRTIGALTVGGGLVLMGVGGILALSAKSKFNDAKSNHCGAAVGGIDDSHCDSVGLDGRSSAASTANTATVFWVLGGLAAAGGAVLWLTAPSGDESLKAGVGPGTLFLKGAF